jgi:hypothetical protein
MTFARTSHLILVTGFAVWCAQTAGAGQTPSLEQVLTRAGAYVEEFQRELSGIVAEETYLQEVIPRLGMNGSGRTQLQRRRLRSDLLLLRPEESVSWLQFRDVFEVDGNAVRDRDERLTKIFLDPDQTTAERVDRIREESARYNIGGIARTMNVPVLPLAVLSPVNQPRFRFTVDDRRRNAAPGSDLPQTPSFRVSAEVWVVRFTERLAPTIIHTGNDKNIFSRGRFWIEPSSGRVLMSEMITEDADVRGQINVSYQSEPLVGLLVPIEMRERYTSQGYRATITGQATYGKFRRFQVDVNETLGPIR